MKLIPTLVCLTLSSRGINAEGNVDSIQNLYQYFMDLRTNATQTTAPADGPSTRFVASARFIFSMLQNYGCWCYLGSEHGQGKGQPQDVYDRLCQIFHLGIECAMMDIDGCDPTAGKQYRVMGASNDAGDINFDCVTLNGGDECAEATCYLESHFTSGFIDQAFNGNSPNINTYNHNLGFDNALCFPNPPQGGLGGYTEECCGSFAGDTRRPIRIPLTQERKCCDKPNGRFTVYNPQLNECCDDGNVGAVGTC